MTNASANGKTPQQTLLIRILIWTLNSVIVGIAVGVAGNAIWSSIHNEEPYGALGGNENVPVYVKVVADPPDEKKGVTPDKITAPSVEHSEISDAKSTVSPVAVPQKAVITLRPVIFFSRDDNSRYIAPYIEEQIMALGIPIENVLGEDAFKLATIELHSEVKSANIDGDSIARLYISVAAKRNDGVLISQERYELVGTSSVDQDTAIRTASGKFLPIAEHLELVKGLRSLVEQFASNGSKR